MIRYRRAKNLQDQERLEDVHAGPTGSQRRSRLHKNKRRKSKKRILESAGFYIYKCMHMDKQTSVYWEKYKQICLQHTITSRYNRASAAEDSPAIGSFARGTNHHSSYYRTLLGPRWHVRRLLSYGRNWLVLIGPAHYLIVIMYLRSSGDLRQPCIPRYSPRFSSILI